MKKKNITEKERYYIELSLKKGLSVVQIACDLGRAKSTIYKEIKRGMCEQKDKNWNVVEKYCADTAQRKSIENMKRTGRKRKLLPTNEWLQIAKDLIISGRYSPEAVIYLIGRNVCVKTLYNYIWDCYVPDLTYQNLPYAKPKKRRKKQIAKRYQKSRSIEQRPQVANERKVYGHWEMDTVYSNRDDRTCLLVLTERKTREEIIRKMPDRTSKSVVAEIDKIERKLGAVQFREKFQTITCDNGVEFSDWTGIEKSCINKKKPRTAMYFCHPYTSSERGSNENQNRMIRRWIPKGDDIGLYSDEEIQRIENWINTYPRKIFMGSSSSSQIKAGEL